MNFTSGNFTALCDKHRFTGVLVKIQRNRCSLLQVKFLVAVDLLVLQTLTQSFSQANGEEFRRKEPDSKAKENGI
jgi:hypothetical protein